MNQIQALAKLRKILGPEMGYRINDKAPSADERAAVRAGFDDLQRIDAEAKAARDARLAELLAGDARYQELRAQATAADRALSNARGKLYAHRIVVGVRGAMFFSVKFEGDNWDDVVRKATAKEAA